MAVASVADFVATLQCLPLLTAEQSNQLPALQQQFPDIKMLGQELVRRGWLTRFQANQVAAGKGQMLVLDQYVLLDKLGEGGMGAVFRARQLRIKRDVALKVIRRDALKAKGAVERFQREAEVAAKLSHPNIVTIHDANEVNGTHFLVMEFIEGTDLARLVETQGPLPAALACECIRQAALGLQHAHEKGLVHRDIKPHNLMRTADGLVKVMDLGLARTALAARETAASQHLTGTGTLMGTADYLAPEQIRDARSVDIRADIYSLGCSLYHLLTGEPPFGGGTIENKIAGHLFLEPRAIAEARPDVPAPLAAVLRKMLAKAVEQRYQTPAEVAQALAPFAEGQKVAAASSFSLPLKASTASQSGETLSLQQSPVPRTQYNGPAPCRRGRASAAGWRPASSSWPRSPWWKPCC